MRVLRPKPKYCFLDRSAMGAVLAALLLLIVMLTVSLVPHHGQGVDLPRVRHPQAMHFPEGEKVVAVMRDGSIYYGQDRVTPEMLLKGLQASGKGRSKQFLYIKADARVKYGCVVAVIDAAHDAGIERIAFITEQARELSELDALL